MQLFPAFGLVGNAAFDQFAPNRLSDSGAEAQLSPRLQDFFDHILNPPWHTNVVESRFDPGRGLHIALPDHEEPDEFAIKIINARADVFHGGAGFWGFHGHDGELGEEDPFGKMVRQIAKKAGLGPPFFLSCWEPAA